MLKKSQRHAIHLFYQKMADAKQTFNDATDNGKRRDHLAWLSYYETKQAAKTELSQYIALSSVADFWHHAHYQTLEEAIEKAWKQKAEADALKQGELYEETKTKRKGKKHKVS